MSEQVRLKTPSARISVSLLDDEDALSLMQRGRDGVYALWAFAGLLILAKTLKNGGVFRGAAAKYASRIGLTPQQLDAAINTIGEAAAENDHEPWIVREDPGFVIRSWDKWNVTTGGPRPGAGRPKTIKRYSSGNQVDYELNTKSKSSGGPSVSSSVSGTGKDPVQPTPTARISPPVLPGAGGDSDGGSGGTGGRGEESFVGGSGWTGHSDGPAAPWDAEGDRRIEIREYLDTIGVRGPAQTEIAEAGVGVDRLESIWQAVCADPGATKKHGVFVAQVRRIYGGGGRIDTLPRAEAGALRRIDEIRRTHQRAGKAPGVG